VNAVTVALPGDANRARYALGVLLSLLGLEARDGAPADVAYGELEGRVRIPAGPQANWDDATPRVRRVAGIPALEPPGARAAPPIGFDLLYATYVCLTAPWERTDPADEVGCPLAAGGFLDRNGLLAEPLVHRYAALLGSELGVPLAGEPALVLTHDVDDNFAHVFERRESLKRLRLELRAGRPVAALRRGAGLARRLARRKRADPNDRFADWVDWHAGWGSRPAFFVASAGLFGDDPVPQDVAYDVRDPVVLATLRPLAEAGAEFGVHFSIRAARSDERLAEERAALERALGAPVRSARHHWWALGRPPEPTWRAHAAAGVALDCSLGFNDRAGFRRGICVPFRPFDPTTGRALDVYVLPTVAMDAAVFDGRPPADALAELRALEEVVREVKGALVLDWHVHAANPAALPGAAEGLRSFVDGARASGLRLRTPLELLRPA
jgi:hypothetical protein